jgi:disulfide bond formation protein DsbB
MKSFKILMMAVLTILSVSVFARTSKKYEAKVSILKSGKSTYICPVHAWMALDKAGMCPECRTTLNLSIKEKMKMGVIQKYNMECNSAKPVSNLNLSSKEKMKREAVKMNSSPADPFVTGNKAYGYPECCTGLKEINMSVTCPMSFSTGNQTKLNLSPKEKMKRAIM